MASINAQQANTSQSASAVPTDAADPVNKRTSIGLSARRPTAPDTVQRPPSAGMRMSAWWLVLCMLVLMIAVAILVAARSLGPDATWGEVASSLGRTSLTSAKALPGASGVHFHDTFNVDNGMLKSYAEPGVAAAKVLPDEGVYRLDVWPGFLAWSRFFVEDVAALTIKTEATIDAQTPDAAVALIGRFEDDDNFYLFTVDGQGRFGAVHYQAGEATVLRPPTSLPALFPAGQPNRLMLEDNGVSLRFLGNDIPLDDIQVEPAPVYRMGFGALATGSDFIAVTFDTVSVYEP